MKFKRWHHQMTVLGQMFLILSFLYLISLHPVLVTAKGIFHVVSRTHQGLSNEEMDNRRFCHASVGFNNRQREICLTHNNLLPTIINGYVMGLSECRHHFRNHRWNCTGHDALIYKNGRSQDKSYLDRMTEHPTREAGFLHAITSASVSYAITKACSSGAHAQCGCDHTAHDQSLLANLLAGGEGTAWEDDSSLPNRVPDNRGSNVNKPPTETKHFKWSGCSDNVHFGTAFARDFVESNEKSRLDFLMQQLRTSEGEIYDGEDGQSQVQMKPRQRKRLRRQHRQRRAAIINLHNHNIGRSVLAKSMRTKCKCHGVSGSCETRTCWRALPRVRDISDGLYDKYRNSLRVRVTSDLRIVSYDGDDGENGYSQDRDGYGDGSSPYNQMVSRSGRAQIPMEGRSLFPHRISPMQELVDKSMVYLKASPSYCQHSLRHGSLGTYNRECNATTADMDDASSCSNMCCGRGYRTQTIVRQVQCRCRFIWCCEVKCDTCNETVHVSTCN